MPVINLHGTPTFQGEAMLLGWAENNRDGMTVRLALDASDENGHPFKGLGTGKHGQRFMVVCVPVDDDTPQEPAKPRQQWDNMPRAQQAGILCGEDGFRQFIGVETADDAKRWIYGHCGVTSRTEIDAKAPQKWDQLVADYRFHQRYEDMRP